MTHPFMADMANGLAERGVATLRYQFPYMEQGSKRPDAPKLAQATVRAAVSAASHLVPEVALFAGGKSFGGRMTSQAQAAALLPGVPASYSWDSRFIQRGKHPTSVAAISSGCIFRCSSSKELVISLPVCRFCSPSSNDLVRTQLSSCFRMLIIPFTCPRARAVAIQKLERKCWMPWRSGSRW